MKIAIAGKGGSGKTTVAAILARTLAREGREVVALDCDSNPNLGVSLGLGAARTLELAAIRQSLDAEGVEHAPDAETLLQRFGDRAPDGVRLAVVTKIEKANPGWPWCGVSPEQLLGQLETAGRVVIADLEAGVGTLTRMAAGSLDALVVVAEPTPKSIEVARRASEIAAERGIGPVRIVANRVRDETDLALLRGAFGDELTLVPEDPAILDADRDGVSPMDASPGPAVRALERVAGTLS